MDWLPRTYPRLADTGASRRAFLQSSLAAMLGLYLPPTRAQVAGPAPDKKVKSCILLWMEGGPSQIDTFDPKPGAPNGGIFKAIDSSVKGVKVCEILPRMAERMCHLTLIRSMVSKEGSHDRAKYLGHTGYPPNPTVQHPSLGSMVAEETGSKDSSLPQFISISSPSFGGGYLGPEYSPLVIPKPSNKVENLTAPPGIERGRLRNRLALLDRLERRFAANHPGKEVRSHHHTYAQAVRFMNAPEVSAFDPEEESESVRSAYGPSEFGQGCLLARRLVEKGVRFVEVTLRGWDTHQDNFTRTQALCAELDPAFAALIDDLRQRDLWESTLVIWMGEFGRTPRINSQEGRDHFTRGWSVALGGCGAPQGLVLGETSIDGTEITQRPVAIPDLFHTALRLLDIDPASEFQTPTRRPITLADKNGKGIEEVLGKV